MSTALPVSPAERPRTRPHDPGSGSESGSAAHDRHRQEALDYARLIAGWALAITLLVLFTRTRLGYVLVYYALWLAILTLILGSYQRVVDLLSVVQAPAEEGPVHG